MSEFWNTVQAIAKGESVTRALLNKRLRAEELRGNVIDVGGGKDDSYLYSMPRADGVIFSTFDVKAGAVIDFETDALPTPDAIYDTVVFLNVLEHIFNHQHLSNEVVRILKPGGQLIGFVPFLMWYHPDHSDYFRYTHEALEKIFTKAGATNIKIESIAGGPFTAASHMIVQSFPKFVRPVVFVVFHALDALYLFFRPGRGERFALGYFFTLTK